MGHKNGIKDILVKLSDKDNIEIDSLCRDFVDYYDEDSKHYYYEIAEFVYESKEDEPERVLDKLNNLKCNSKLDNINEKIEKLYDHIKLELVRKNRTAEDNNKAYRYIFNVMSQVKTIQSSNDDLAYEMSNLKEGVESTSKEAIEKIENTIENVNRISCKTEELFTNLSEKVDKTERDMLNNKFDLIALTTLVFTAFTVISINATLFASAMDNIKSLRKMVGLMATTNLIVLSTVFCIYQIIRKIHGEVRSNRHLYVSILIIFILLVGISVFALWPIL